MSADEETDLKIRRVDWYFDEWLAGTARLDAAVRGVYVTICNMIYSHGGPIESEGLASLCGCHGNTFRRVMDRLKTLGKIIENGSQISVKRCGKEIEKARIRLVNARENGGKGGRRHKKINEVGKPTGYFSEKLAGASFNLQPPTIKDSEAKASAAAVAPAVLHDPVKILWNKGLALLLGAQLPDGRARRLIGGWRKEFSDAAVLAAIVACEHEAASEPVAFIASCLHNSRKGMNGHGRLTAANERFIAGREATFRAVLDAEDRERAAHAGYQAGDSS
jgi:uncharacterized protein YdaU (DUF1376 family)